MYSTSIIIIIIIIISHNNVIISSIYKRHKNLGSISVREHNKFCLLQSTQMGCGAKLASYTRGNRGGQFAAHLPSSTPYSQPHVSI